MKISNRYSQNYRKELLLNYKNKKGGTIYKKIS